MKQILALIAIVALVGISFAQDLDCPKTGTAQAQQQAQQGGGSLFDQLIARIRQGEAEYIALGNRIMENGIHSEWVWFRFNPDFSLNNYYNWGGAMGQMLDEARQFWTALSPAEVAAARVEFQASWQRVIAAGLN